MMKMSRRGLMKLGAALGAGLAAGRINGLVSPKEAQATQDRRRGKVCMGNRSYQSQGQRQMG